MVRGWFNEPQRHALAARGYKTVPPEYRKKGYEIYKNGTYEGFTEDLEEASMHVEEHGGKVVSSTNRRKIIYKVNMFELYAQHGRKEATIDILDAIHNGTQRDVVKTAHEYKHLGAMDTASREEIARHWNRVHPNDPFDYDLWYG